MSKDFTRVGSHTHANQPSCSCHTVHTHTHAKVLSHDWAGPGGVVGLGSSSEQGLERKTPSLFFNLSPLQRLEQNSQERMEGPSRKR